MTKLYPSWLTRKIKFNTDSYGKWPILNNHSILDHFEKRKDEKGRDMYISQPYGLSYGEIMKAVEICEKITLDLT
jgi:hypothetical protein